MRFQILEGTVASVEGSLSPLSDDAQAQEKVGKSAKQSEFL